MEKVLGVAGCTLVMKLFDVSFVQLINISWNHISPALSLCKKSNKKNSQQFLTSRLFGGSLESP